MATENRTGCFAIVRRTFFRLLLAIIISVLILFQLFYLGDQLSAEIIEDEQALAYFHGSNELDLLAYFDEYVRNSYLLFEVDAFGLPREQANQWNPTVLENIPIDEARSIAEAFNGDLYYRFSDVIYEGDQTLLTHALVVVWEIQAGMGILALLFMPAYVLGLPIMVIFSLRGVRGMTGAIWWSLMLILLGTLVLTAALNYVTIARIAEELNVNGLDYMMEFGAGMFGGLVTGTALAFLTAAFAFFSGSQRHIDDED